jgi:hypothetical protein
VPHRGTDRPEAHACDRAGHITPGGVQPKRESDPRRSDVVPASRTPRRTFMICYLPVGSSGGEVVRDCSIYQAPSSRAAGLIRRHRRVDGARSSDRGSLSSSTTSSAVWSEKIPFV